MGKETLIVKRRGHREPFDDRKLYGSIYAATQSALCDEPSCELLAGRITNEVKAWLKNRKTVDSKDIRAKVKAEIEKRDPEIAFFYDRHIPNLRRL